MTKVKKTIWSKLGYALLSFALVVTTLFASVNAVAKAEVTNSEKRHFQDGLAGYINVNEETGAIEQKNYTTEILVDGFDGDDAEFVINLFLAKKEVYDRFTAEDKATPEAFLQTALMVFENVWDDVFAAPEAVKTRINDELAPLLEQEGGVKYSDKGTFLSVKTDFEALDENQQAYVMYKGQEALEENYTEEYETYLAVKNALEAIEARLDALVEKIEGVELNADELDTMLDRGVKLSDETAFLAIEEEYLALPDLEGSIYTEKKYVDERVTHDAETYAECPTDVVNIELVRAALSAIKARLDNIYEMIVSTDREVQDMNVLTHVAYVRPLGHMVEYGVHVSDSETFGTIDGYYQAVVDETEKAYLDGKLAEVEQMLEDTSAYTAPETNVYNIEYVREALRQKEAQLNALVEAIVNTTSDKVTIAVMDGNEEVEVEVTPLGYILANFDYSYKADFDYVDGAYRVLGGDALEYVNDALADYNQLDDETYPTEDMVEEGDDFYPTSVVNIELLRELFNAKEEYLNDLVAAIENASDEEQVVVEYEDGEEEIERPLHFMTIDGVGYADKADFDFIDAAYAALTEAEKAYVDERVTAVTDEVYTNKVTDVKYIEDVREALTQIETALNWLVQAIEGTEEFDMPLADIEYFVPEQIMPEEGDTFTVKPLGKMLEDGVVLEDLYMFRFIDNVYAFLNGDGLEAELAYVNENVTAVEEGAEYTNQLTNVKNIEDVREELNTIFERLNELVKKIALVNEELEGVPAAVPFTFEFDGENYPSVAGLLNQFLTMTNNQEELDEEAYATLMIQAMNLILEYKPVFDSVDGEYKALEGAELEYVNKVLADQYREILPSLEENEEVFPDRETNVMSLESYREFYNMIVEELDEVVKRIEEEASYEVEEEQATNTVNPLHYMTIRGVEYSDKEAFEEIDEIYGMLSGTAKEYVDERVTAVTDEVYTNKVTDVKYIEDVREALARREAELDELVKKIVSNDCYEVGEGDEVETVTPLGYMLGTGVGLEHKDAFDAIDDEYQGLTDAERAYVDEQLARYQQMLDEEALEEYTAPETKVLNIEEVREALAQRETELDALVEKIEGVELNEGELDTMLDRGVNYNTDKDAFDAIDAEYAELTEAEKAYVDAKVTAVEEGAEYANQVTDVKNIEDVREALAARETELDALVEKIEGEELGENELDTMLENGVKLSDKDAFDAIDAAYQALEGAEKEYVDANVTVDEETYANEETQVRNIEEVRRALAEIEERLNLLVKKIAENAPFEINPDVTFDPVHYIVSLIMTEEDEEEQDEQEELNKAELMALMNQFFAYKATFDLVDEEYKALEGAELEYVNSKLAEDYDEMIVIDPEDELAQSLIEGLYQNRETDVASLEAYRALYNMIKEALDELVKRIEADEPYEVVAEVEWNEETQELDNTYETVDPLNYMTIRGVKLSDKRAFDEIDAMYAMLSEAEALKAYLDERLTPVTDEEYTNQVTEVKYIEDVREALTQLIQELHDRINEVIDGENTDIDSADEIINDHDGLDEEQSNDLADAFEGEYDNYWQEFMDAYNKLRFAMFFKQAVQEVYEQVTDRDYFTVEGYAVEKMLNSIYCSFAFIEFGNGKTLQDLVKDPCETQLAEIDAAYELKDENGNLVHARHDYAKLQAEIEQVAEDVADLLDPENENSLAHRLAALEAQLNPETEGSLAAEFAALQQEVADLLDPNKEGSLAHKLAALEAQLDPETEGSLAAEFAALQQEVADLLDPNKEGSLADKVAKLQTALATLQDKLDPNKEGSIAAELNSAKERLAALEGKDTLIEQELATLRSNLAKEMNQLKEDNKKEVDALKAENEQLKKDLDDKTSKLNKTMLIGLIALGVVAVALVACVAVLFGKTKALSGGSSKKDEE